MKINQIKKREITLFIVSGILLIFGILCCCMRVGGLDVFSWLVGLSLCVGGLGLAIYTALPDKSLLDAKGIISGVAFGLGVAFIYWDLGYLFVSIIPFVLIGFGLVLIADAILVIVIPFRKNITLFAVELVVGIISLVLGILSVTVEWFEANCDIIFGIIIILSAIALVFYALFVNPDAYKKYMTTKEDAEAYKNNKAKEPETKEEVKEEETKEETPTESIEEENKVEAE